MESDMELGDTYSDFNSGGPGAGAAGVEAGADARRQGDFWGWSGRRAKAGVAAMAVAATEVATRVIRTGTEDDMPRRDANIWSLYLVEAEKKVKRQADLWNTNLEYLLVFVSCSFAVSETILTHCVGWSVCRSCGHLPGRQQTRSPTSTTS